MLLLDEPLGGVDPASAELIIGAVRRAARGGPHAARVHPRRGERAPLRPGAVPEPPPGGVRAAGARRCGREVLEATYGSEIVVLERRRRAAAGDRRPAPRALMDLLDLLLDPWRSGHRAPRAARGRAARRRSAARSRSGSSSYRLSYPAESLAHGLLPGLVLAALAGAPLLLGAGAGVARGRGAGGAGRARRARSAPTRPPRWWSPGCSASAACWPCRPTPRRAWRSCCSATRSA